MMHLLLQQKPAVMPVAEARQRRPKYKEYKRVGDAENFARNVLGIPVNPSEQWRVDSSAVDQHQQFVGELMVKASRGYGPFRHRSPAMIL